MKTMIVYKPQTFGQKLNHVPIKIRRKILRYTNRNFKKHNIDITYFLKETETTLYFAFIFTETPEGHSYWSQINNKYFECFPYNKD